MIAYFLTLQRDVGGPGIVSNTLVGVISFGSPVCGAHDSPTVFTKLGYYAEWIDGIVKPVRFFFKLTLII